MPIVSNDVTYPGGAIPATVHVRVELIASRNPTNDPNGTIITGVGVAPYDPATGIWAVTLPGNATLVDPGSTYRIVESIPRSDGPPHVSVYEFIMPNTGGPYDLSTLLISSPMPAWIAWTNPEGLRPAIDNPTADDDGFTVQYDHSLGRFLLVPLPTGGGGSGVSDHGALTGLADDDHSQYLTATRHGQISGNPHGTTFGQVGAEAAGTSITLMNFHTLSDPDPHTMYLRQVEADALYPAIAHDHDGTYSPVGHNHAGVYSPVAHNHDGAYAPASHSHVVDFADLTGTLADSQVPASIARLSKSVEVDFGTTPVSHKLFTVTDIDAVAGTQVVCAQSLGSATGRAADENELDPLVCSASVLTPGEIRISVTALRGNVTGKYRLVYSF
jgi:hypothetical protein